MNKRSLSRYGLRPFLLTVLPLTALAIACDSDDPAGPEDANRQAEVRPIIVAFDSQPDDWPGDLFAALEATLQADTMTLRVSFTGGCRDHRFELVAWSGWLESEPVQANLLLSHDDQGDPCEAEIIRDLRFDLTPLREDYRDAYRTVSDTVILNLDGGFGSISYGF